MTFVKIKNNMKNLKTAEIEPCPLIRLARNLTIATTICLCYEMKYIIYLNILRFHILRGTNTSFFFSFQKTTSLLNIIIIQQQHYHLSPKKKYKNHIFFKKIYILY